MHQAQALVWDDSLGFGPHLEQINFELTQKETEDLREQLKIWKELFLMFTTTLMRMMTRHTVILASNSELAGRLKNIDITELKLVLRSQTSKFTYFK
jgi:hypothetical protein